MDYRPFIGRAYEPPHGCFRLVQQVFAEAYRVRVPDFDAGLPPGYAARGARFHAMLAAHCVPVSAPREGDVIVIGGSGRPWHIGIVIEPGEMLHSYRGGSAVIESYRDPGWWRRIEGFYRYAG